MLNEQFNSLNNYLNGENVIPPITGIESKFPYGSGSVSLSVKKEFINVVDVMFEKSFDRLNSYTQTINIESAREYAKFFSLIASHLEKKIGDSR